MVKKDVAGMGVAGKGMGTGVGAGTGKVVGTEAVAVLRG